MPATEQDRYTLEFPIFMYALLPFIYFVIGYITIAMICLVYNFLYKFVGGFEFETREQLDHEHPPHSNQPKVTILNKRLLPLTLVLGLTVLFIDQPAPETQVSAIQEEIIVQQADCGSVHGISLPCWDDYLSGDGPEGSESLPYYPYAKRPNGCSFPGATPGTNDLIKVAGITIRLTDICNEHDRCYYTLGTTPWQCNDPFQNRLRARCVSEFAKQAPNTFDILTAGIAREEAQILCGVETMVVAGAVIGTQDSRHQLAQERQRDYLSRVDRFVKENADNHTLKVFEQ